MRQCLLDRYVALFLATIVWPDLPHRYHHGRLVTPESCRISKSNSLAQGVLCILPQPGSTYKHPPCSSNGMGSVSHVRQYNVCSLSCRYIPTSSSRTMSSSSPNSVTIFLDFRRCWHQAVPARKSSAVDHLHSKRRFAIGLWPRFKALVGPKLPGNR